MKQTSPPPRVVTQLCSVLSALSQNGTGVRQSTLGIHTQAPALPLGHRAGTLSVASDEWCLNVWLQSGSHAFFLTDQNTAQGVFQSLKNYNTHITTVALNTWNLLREPQVVLLPSFLLSSIKNFESFLCSRRKGIYRRLRDFSCPK